MIMSYTPLSTVTMADHSLGNEGLCQSAFEIIPAEIRLQIYRELLISSDVIDIDWKKPKLHPNIMRTCKAVFSESHPILYDENTFRVRMNLPQKLKDAIPVTPVQRVCGDFKYDQIAEARNLSFSYLNDIFPNFYYRESSLYGGLWRNKAYPREQHNYEKEKFPRRLVITIEGQDLENIERKLDELAQMLQTIPRIYSLAISCENTPPDFWTTNAGIRLGEKLCVYLGGSIRRVRMVTTHNMPEEYATVLTYTLTSQTLTNGLIPMLRALRDYEVGLSMGGRTIDGKRAAWKIDDSPGSHLDQASRAMERGDFEAFRYHREQEMRRADGITSHYYSIEELYRYDPKPILSPIFSPSLLAMEPRLCSGCNN